ncbi:MAG: ankyrin repeat domain-containing protein, partial [Tepidisphaeraceae bacterium]
QKYGITLVVHDPPPHTDAMVTFKPLVEGDNTDATALKRYLRLFREEIRKYPPAFVRATGLKRIVFVKEINNQGQTVGAVPDFRGHAVFYDPLRGAATPVYQRHVVHHEFFHLADYALHGDAFLTDPYWAMLNHPDFRYGSGGRNATGSDQFSPTDEHPGFVNLYATSAIEEDRAEIFATTWIPTEAALMRRRAGQRDEVLRLKIARTRALVDFYATQPRTAAEQRTRDFFAALRQRNEKRAEELLAEDPSLAKSTDWLGRTPLHWAAMPKDARRAKWLIASGTAAGTVDAEGWTPLHVSAFLGDEAVAELLLAADADADLKDKRKRTPLDWATTQNQVGMIHLLKSR